MVSTSSFMLGIVGGLLDFASATDIVISRGGGGTMNESLGPSYAWAATLGALGFLVVLTAVLSVMAVGVRHLRGFSILMVVLGLLMAAIGGLMSGGSIAGSSLIYSYGMLIVGVLMAIDGAMMLRNPMPV